VVTSTIAGQSAAKLDDAAVETFDIEAIGGAEVGLRPQQPLPLQRQHRAGQIVT
jgi:hypothetical protein